MTGRRRALFIASLALLLCLPAVFYAPRALAQAWLLAWLLPAFVSLGAIALLLVHGLTGGAWGDESRPLWSAMAAAMVPLALLLLPLLPFVHLLFPWIAPPETLPEVVQRKTFYLNLPFFLARTVLFLALWSVLAHCLQRPVARRRWHAPGLILWALSVTFFSYDWIMSLEPRFYSDVFGMERMLFAVGAALASALALGAARLRPAIRLDLANIWLSVILGWAFVNYSQLIVIWSANLPDEILWYAQRSQGHWQRLGWISVAGYLVVPFAMLVPTAAKRRSGWLRLAAGVALGAYLLHSIWLLYPSLTLSLPSWLLLPPALTLLLAAALAWLSDTQRSALLARGALTPAVLSPAAPNGGDQSAEVAP